MKINPDHIKEAENILIGEAEFDTERIEFINCLDTIDLLAVPGSGKTTALLAKLYCMAKQMPFPANAGILVLSHTNHAIEEIEKVLKPICPQLFTYPNFIGTVQSFVNKFIANQANFDFYGSYIRKNDDEIYFYEVEKFYNGLRWSTKGYKPQNLRNKLLGLINAGKKYEDRAEAELNVKNFLKNCFFDLAERKIKIGKQTKLKFGGITEPYYIELENWKINLLSDGILSFKDSFDISKRYLKNEKSENLKSILQYRFKYIFIDEMQDLDQDQISLIDDIFFTVNSTTVIQRIGDKNQAIYSSKSLGSEIVWKSRHEIDSEKFKRNLSINNSYRLTPNIAKLVDGFILNRDEGYEVIGKSRNNEIPPYLLVYNDENNANKLKEKFVELIKEFKLEKNAIDLGHGFHIVAWTTDKEEGSDKWHLKKLYPEYSKESKQNKEDFDCLRKHVFLFDQNKSTFESIRKSILNGILRVLRIEQIYHDAETKKHFRKSSFVQLVKDQGDIFYQDFKEKLFNLCFSLIIIKNYEEIFIEYTDFLKNLLMHIIPDFEVSKSVNFINKSFNFKVSDLQESNNLQSSV